MNQLQDLKLDLIEAETDGDRLTDLLDQIADLAQRWHTDIVNMMAIGASNKQSNQKSDRWWV